MAKDIQKALKDLERVVKHESIKIVEKTTDEIGADARTLAPPSIANSVSVSHSNGRSTIEVSNPISAYIEFGTGQHVFKRFKPRNAEDQAIYEQYAKTFYKNGKGKARQQPFLFPALFRSRNRFGQRLKKAIEDSFK